MDLCRSAHDNRAGRFFYIKLLIYLIIKILKHPSRVSCGMSRSPDGLGLPILIGSRRGERSRAASAAGAEERPVSAEARLGCVSPHS
jgi:hypothetical protein